MQPKFSQRQLFHIFSNIQSYQKPKIATIGELSNLVFETKSPKDFAWHNVGSRLSFIVRGLRELGIDGDHFSTTKFRPASSLFRNHFEFGFFDPEVGFPQSKLLMMSSGSTQFKGNFHIIMCDGPGIISSIIQQWEKASISEFLHVILIQQESIILVKPCFFGIHIQICAGVTKLSEFIDNVISVLDSRNTTIFMKKKQIFSLYSDIQPEESKMKKSWNAYATTFKGGTLDKSYFEGEGIVMIFRLIFNNSKALCSFCKS